ncbi:MAG: von Willebrand factor type A domain-containing protein [Planctomycetaceae bacterium]
MSEELHNIPIEPELEARIVALVLGEASDFEAEELNRLVALHPELAAFKLQMEQIHGSLKQISTGELETPEAEWKLPAERRSVVMAAIRGEADVPAAASTFQEPVGDTALVPVTAGGTSGQTANGARGLRRMLAESIGPVLNSVRLRFRRTPARIAAGICVASLFGLFGWNSFLSREHARQVTQSNSLRQFGMAVHNSEDFAEAFRRDAGADGVAGNSQELPVVSFADSAQRSSSALAEMQQALRASDASALRYSEEVRQLSARKDVQDSADPILKGMQSDVSKVESIIADLDASTSGLSVQGNTIASAPESTLTSPEPAMAGLVTAPAVIDDLQLTGKGYAVDGRKEQAAQSPTDDSPVELSIVDESGRAKLNASSDAPVVRVLDGQPGVATGGAGGGPGGGGGRLSRGGDLGDASSPQSEDGAKRSGGARNESGSESDMAATLEQLVPGRPSEPGVLAEGDNQDGAMGGKGQQDESRELRDRILLEKAKLKEQIELNESLRERKQDSFFRAAMDDNGDSGARADSPSKKDAEKDNKSNGSDGTSSTLMFGDLSTQAESNKPAEAKNESEGKQRDVSMGHRFQTVDDFELPESKAAAGTEPSSGSKDAVAEVTDEGRKAGQSPAFKAENAPFEGLTKSEPQSLAGSKRNSESERDFGLPLSGSDKSHPEEPRFSKEVTADKRLQLEQPENSPAKPAPVSGRMGKALSIRESDGEVVEEVRKSGEELEGEVRRGSESSSVRSRAAKPAPARVSNDDRKGVSSPVAPPAGLNETNAAAEAFSTFSLHVSDVSFKLASAALAKGEWPEASKIRIEEFVNAFDYGDPLPGKNERVSCAVEQGIHPFLQQRNVLRVSMRTSAEGRAANTPLRLTFVLDNSGSMERADRQATVRKAFALLSQQLTAIDQVTLISFSRQPRLLAENISGTEAAKLVQLVEQLPSEGGTNIEAALQLAFKKTASHKTPGAQHRIVLLTDGAVNLGNANPESLSRMVESMRESGIAFDAAGISADGLNDEVLEALTRKGDGRYYLMDSQEDADDSFVQQIAGALRPSASNVKVQVEFNPKRVGQYKLLGFEKHLLKQEDFRNDTVDAAEMAAAEAGVAMYQFEARPDGEGDVGSVSVRFRDLSTGEMVEHRWPIPYEPDAARPDQATPSLRIATAAAMLAAKLKGEALGETVDLQTLSRMIDGIPSHMQSNLRIQQLKAMIEQARQLEAN